MRAPSGCLRRYRGAGVASYASTTELFTIPDGFVASLRLGRERRLSGWRWGRIGALMRAKGAQASPCQVDGLSLGSAFRHEENRLHPADDGSFRLREPLGTSGLIDLA